MTFSTFAGSVAATEKRRLRLRSNHRAQRAGTSHRMRIDAEALSTTLDDCFSTISPIANFRILAGVTSLQWRPRWLELPQDRSHEERLHDYATVTRPSRRVHVDIEAWWYHFDASGPGIDDGRGPEP